jgi:hypothetical protein
VHFDGVHVSVYFALFTAEYLHTLRDVNVDLLNDMNCVRLQHTHRYNLLKHDERTEFIKEFVALLRFIAAGEANIGELRLDSQVIHRSDEEVHGVIHPPQEAMDEPEEDRWRVLYATEFAD